MNQFLPEGRLINKEENQMIMHSPTQIKEAYMQNRIVEARAILCDSHHDLWVDLGCMKGKIPRKEGAIGISEGTVRDIALISRVNKPVSFYITDFEKNENNDSIAILSRRAVQEQCQKNYLNSLIPGDIIDAKITHMESFGIFADIGAGITSLLPIDMISVSRIPHPNERFQNGENIKAVVKNIDEKGRISLTHKELLGTWEENIAQFESGETVSGIVRSVENYGIFVELAPNLAGLAELKPNVTPGQLASVYIKSIIPERMKIKLVIIDSFNENRVPTSLKYYINESHINKWEYSPLDCQKHLFTLFNL